MPIYIFQHPNTGELFDDIRTFAKAEEPYVAADGVVCERVLYPKSSDGKKHPKGLIDKNCEVWEKDPSAVRKLNPKYVRTRDGKRIRYNPNTMM